MMLFTVVYLLPVATLIQHGVGDSHDCNCTLEEWQTWGECNSECFGQTVRERDVTFNDHCQFSDCAALDDRFEFGSCNTVCQNNGAPTGNLSVPCNCASGYYESCCTERVDCGAPESIENGNVAYTTTDYDSAATYTCNPLFNITNGDTVRYCQNNFTWGGKIPECISVNHCSSTPCTNGATCVDLLGDFRCDCSQGWSGQICEIDVQPPVVEGCSNNVLLNATESTIYYNWTEPTFTDPMGTELDIASNYGSPEDSFSWGDHTVVYTATKLLNGLKTNCTFTVRVRPKPCEDLNVPVNGARICNGWRTDFGRFCMITCLQNYTLGPSYSFRTWRTCGASGTWIPSIPFPDCSLRVYSEEDATVYQPEYSSHTYETPCENPATQSALKQLYIDKLKQHYGLSSFCTNNIEDCVPDNVEAACHQQAQ